jgi:hypothetical protein
MFLSAAKQLFMCSESDCIMWPPASKIRAQNVEENPTPQTLVSSLRDLSSQIMGLKSFSRRRNSKVLLSHIQPIHKTITACSATPFIKCLLVLLEYLVFEGVEEVAVLGVLLLVLRVQEVLLQLVDAAVNTTCTFN